MIIAVVLLLVNAAAISVNKWLETRLYISFRAEITRKILTLYYSKHNYYQLSESPVDNADQRISMDVERFSRKSSNVIAVIVILPFTIGYYTYEASAQTGWLGP